MPGNVRPVRRARVPNSRIPIAGDRPDTTADILGDPPNGIYDGERFVPARQRGAFKRFPGTDERNPGGRGKPERFQPIRFDFGDLPREIGQRPPPSSPFGVSQAMLSPSGPLIGINRAVQRRLATLPIEFQEQVLQAVQGVEPTKINGAVEQSIDQGLYLIQTPGMPTTEDLRAALGLPQEYLKGVPVTTDELNDARAALMGGAGTEGPEPSEEDLFTEVIQSRQEERIDSGIFFPPSASVPFTPQEDLQAEESKGE